MHIPTLSSCVRRLFFISLICIFPSISYGATIYTNSTTGNDTTGDGTISLPYRTFTKAYTIATSGDTINLTGTFSWSDAAETLDVVYTGVTLSKNLTLVGQGVTQTIIQAGATSGAANNKRVFTVVSTSTVSVQNLTIQNGWLPWGSYGNNTYGGGGIRNDGVLTVSQVNFIGNAAAGCSYCGMGYGGAIYNTGTTTVTQSYFSNNSAWYTGGAVANGGGSLSVTNSTIYANSMFGDQASSNYGAAVGTLAGITTLTNITATGNAAKNGGGLYTQGTSTVYLKNSIFAENYATTTAQNNIYRSAGTITNNGYNIVGISSGFATTTGDWYDSTNTGSYRFSGSTATGTINLDTRASLNDNPNLTSTVAILPTGATSIAIDRGDVSDNNSVSVPTTDQRGATRSGTLDIGAYELNGGGLSISAPSTQLSSITITDNQYKQQSVSWTNGNGVRRVLFMKQVSSGTASPVDGTRYVASSTFGAGAEIGGSGWFAISEGYATSVTVTGLTPNTAYTIQGFEYNGVDSSNSVYYTSSASNNPKSFTTYQPITRYLNSVTGNDTTGDGTVGAPWKTFTKAYASSSAGDTIDALGTFTWTDTAETGDVTLTGFTISKDLTIDGRGPSQTIFQASSTQSTDRRVFTVATTSEVIIQDVSIKNGFLNWTSYTSNTYGGAGIRNNSVLTVRNSEFVNNRAAGCLYCGMGYGGAFLNTGSSTVTGSTFYNNTSWYTGGALASGFVSTARLNLSNSTFYNNSMFGDQAASNYGAGVGITAGTAHITNVTITANGAINGGGLYVQTAGTEVYLKNSIIAGNSATTTAFANIYRISGTLTNNGYNVVGTSTGFATTTGDWFALSNNDVYRLSGSSTTAGLGLISPASTNTNPYETKTFALTATSSAVNRGNATNNNSVEVPTTDQRGASRSGVIDIGSFEYDGGGLTDTTPPVISSIASSTTHTTATISWSTDETATSTVNYGLTTSYGLATSTTVSTTTHSVILDGLTPSTVYHVQISVVDSSGNLATSSDYVVTTSSAPDVTAPVISSVASTTGVTTANIYWTTNENATSTVQYGLTTGYGTASSTSVSSTTHSLALTGLTAETTYYFKVISIDSSGNIASSTGYTFRTLIAPDVTAPSISGVASSTGTTTAHITWTTNEVATSTVLYGLTNSYGSASSSLVATTSHAIDITGLVASTTYYFKVVSTDSSGNTASSTGYTFNTPYVPPTAPTPSSISATSTNTTITITWSTSVAASSRVSFGLTNSYSSSTEQDVSTKVTNHSITISGLSSCTLFNYIVSGTSADALTATSSNATVYTRGCTGNSSVSATGFGNIATSTGGTLAHERVTVVVPAAFTGTSSAALFQAHTLDSTIFFATAGTPMGKVQVGNTVINLEAMSSLTERLTTFSSPITVVLSYNLSDVTGVDPTTLWMYRYSQGVWYPLSSCVTDTLARTVTCTTVGFSDFSIFGEASVTTPTISTGTVSIGTIFSSSVIYGCKDVTAINYNEFSAHDAKLCEYLKKSVVPTQVFVKDLKMGQSGKDVTLLQEKLIIKNSGLKSQALKKHGANGYFGPLTKSAVIEFQKKYKIPATGIVGPLTRGVLFK